MTPLPAKTWVSFNTGTNQMLQSPKAAESRENLQTWRSFFHHPLRKCYVQQEMGKSKTVEVLPSCLGCSPQYRKIWQNFGTVSFAFFSWSQAKSVILRESSKQKAVFTRPLMSWAARGGSGRIECPTRHPQRGCSGCCWSPWALQDQAQLSPDFSVCWGLTTLWLLHSGCSLNETGKTSFMTLQGKGLCLFLFAENSPFSLCPDKTNVFSH